MLQFEGVGAFALLQPETGNWECLVEGASTSSVYLLDMIGRGWTVDVREVGHVECARLEILAVESPGTWSFPLLRTAEARYGLAKLYAESRKN